MLLHDHKSLHKNKTQKINNKAKHVKHNNVVRSRNHF